MFTGLIQSQGKVVRNEPDGQGGQTLVIAEPTMAPQLQLGESIAVNGACLTVVDSNPRDFTFQLGPETVKRTTFGNLNPGDRVNLERALRVGDPIGGHFVTGHIDAVGTVEKLLPAGEWLIAWFAVPKGFDELLVSKGSICVDGVSLTLVDVEPGRFSVMLIPHTRTATTLGGKVVGAAVNLEFDLLAKHVRKLFQSMTLTV